MSNLTFEEKVNTGVFSIKNLQDMIKEFQGQLDSGETRGNRAAVKERIVIMKDYLHKHHSNPVAETKPSPKQQALTTRKTITLNTSSKAITRDKGVTDEDVARKFLQVKDSAKERGIDFTLNLTTVRNLMNAKKCNYTGLPYDYSDPQKMPSFDRIDYSKGYIKGNVVSCRKDVNDLKNVLIEHPVSVFKDNPKLLQKVVNKWVKQLG